MKNSCSTGTFDPKQCTFYFYRRAGPFSCTEGLQAHFQFLEAWKLLQKSSSYSKKDCTNTKCSAFKPGDFKHSGVFELYLSQAQTYRSSYKANLLLGQNWCYQDFPAPRQNLRIPYPDSYNSRWKGLEYIVPQPF